MLQGFTFGRPVTKLWRRSEWDHTDQASGLGFQALRRRRPRDFRRPPDLEILGAQGWDVGASGGGALQGVWSSRVQLRLWRFGA